MNVTKHWHMDCATETVSVTQVNSADFAIVVVVLYN